jgi:hypothetical protein
LNKKLPKRGCGSCPVHSTLLTEESVASVAPMRGMIMGRAMVDTNPHASTVRWSTTTKLTPGPNGGITTIVTQRRRPGMLDRTRPLTPVHETEVFVRLSTTPRERARRLQPSIVSNGLWNAWSVNRRQLLPLRRRLRRNSMRFSARVSLSLFIEILNCLKFARSPIPFHRAKGFVPLSTLMESIWVAAGSLAVRSIWF